MTTTDTVQGLRDLADFIEANPDLPHDTHSRILVYLFGDDARDTLAEFARRFGTCRKDVDNSFYGVEKSFGPIDYYIYASREAVCERVVKGTREVTREIPDPAAPKVTVTETVEDVEWVCTPLLADEPSPFAEATS